MLECGFVFHSFPWRVLRQARSTPLHSGYNSEDGDGGDAGSGWGDADISFPALSPTAVDVDAGVSTRGTITPTAVAAAAAAAGGAVFVGGSDGDSSDGTDEFFDTRELRTPGDPTAPLPGASTVAAAVVGGVEQAGVAVESTEVPSATGAASAGVVDACDVPHELSEGVKRALPGLRLLRSNRQMFEPHTQARVAVAAWRATVVVACALTRCCCRWVGGLCECRSSSCSRRT